MLPPGGSATGSLSQPTPKGSLSVIRLSRSESESISYDGTLWIGSRALGLVPTHPYQVDVLLVCGRLHQSPLGSRNGNMTTAKGRLDR
jgi:hypothetical protein